MCIKILWKADWFIKQKIIFTAVREIMQERKDY